MEVHYQTSFC
jgi:hypothetical protein